MTTNWECSDFMTSWLHNVILTTRTISAGIYLQYTTFLLDLFQCVPFYHSYITVLFLFYCF